jgi:hypothetical protein
MPGNGEKSSVGYYEKREYQSRKAASYSPAKLPIWSSDMEEEGRFA